MKIRKPSPAMVVALIALVAACSGSAVAAVNFADKAGFARQAGAVDKKSAVSAGSSVKQARGRLVATARSGRSAGRIPSKFLADVTRGQTFATSLQVPDNSTGAAVLLDRTGFGSLTVSCSDQNSQAGREDPTASFTFTNSSGASVNFSRRAGTTDLELAQVPPGVVKRFTINNSNPFELQLEQTGVQVLVQGVARQDGRNTPAAVCVVYGAGLVVGG